jgi:hypothetical protein
MRCSRCGHDNAAGKRFCVRCAATLAAQPAQPDPAPAVNPTLQASLERLGLRLSSRHLVGFAIAAVVGLMTPPVLLRVYPYVFYPLLQVVFDGNPSGASDSFNTFMMTALTFLSSFLVAFLFFRKA